jgi:hypothetical protein
MTSEPPAISMIVSSRLRAALEVGVAAQQEPTERAEEEGEGVGGKREDKGQRLVFRREDLGGEVDREGGVDRPVVPLDGVAHTGGDEGAYQQLVRCLRDLVGRHTRGRAGARFLMASYGRCSAEIGLPMRTHTEEVRVLTSKVTAKPVTQICGGAQPSHHKTITRLLC